MLFIFDMGGVVTTTFAMDLLYKKLNINQKTFFSICNELKPNIWDEFEIGNISSREFWNEFNQRVLELNGKLDLSNVPQVKTDLFRLYFHPSKNLRTVELIQELKKKHRVVCGTNTIQSHWENHMERGDYSFFNQTYASNKIGAAKPDPEFFRLILEAEGYPPEEAFFTDDKEENCSAAQSLGINAVHFTTPEELWKAWEKYI